MSSSIGIKIANGEFYPVVEEGSTVKKRLILTTVHDNQRSVQIDLYRSEANTMADAVYVGSLVVEDIALKQRGEPSIELIIGSDGNDELNAEAIDMDGAGNGERQHLTVSLQALEGDSIYEVPDFELENEAVPPPSGLYDQGSARQEDYKKGGVSPLIPILAGVLVVIVLLGLLFWILFGRGKKAEPAPQVTSPVIIEAPVTAAPTAVPTLAPTAVPVATAAAAVPTTAPTPRPTAVPVSSRRRAPVYSYSVPSVIPRDGAPYKIRWGDTLWDISEAFYRNAWLYPRIARFNSIRNPDLIISGTVIRIPPR